MAKKMLSKGSEKEVAPTLKDYNLLYKPVVTEKSSVVGGVGSCIVFKVDPAASKVQIKNAIEKVFKVEVQKVRTCNFLGKLKRTNRSVGRRASFKKAYVSLKPGHTIDLVEGL